MFRQTCILLKQQGGGNKTGPHRAQGVQFRRRSNPRARGASLAVRGHMVADGLRSHTMFNLGEWKFQQNRSSTMQNTRVEGLGGPTDTRYPSQEKPWDDSWGELDNSKTKSNQQRVSGFPDRKTVGDRKLIPKIVVPKNFKSIETWSLKPYVARNAKMLYQDDEHFVKELYDEPVKSEFYWESVHREAYKNALEDDMGQLGSGKDFGDK